MTEPSPPQEAKPRRRQLAAGALLLGLLAVAAALYPRVQPSSPAGSQGPTAGQPLSFLVTNPEGRPVPGARIVVEAGKRCQQETRTGADGRARAPGCGPGPAVARTEAAGLARTKTAIPANQGPGVIAVPLAWATKLTGLVRDERGTPVSSAKIGARSLLPEGNEEAWLAITDDTGRFSLDTLNGESLSLEVSAALHERTVLPTVTPVTGEPLEIVLPRTAAIAGRVLDAQGKPGAAVEVSLAGSGVWPAQTTQTNAAGVFRFEPLPEGVYELRAARAELVSEPFEGLSVDAGQEVPVVLKLVQGARLRGRVFDARSGQGLAAAEIQLGEDALSATPRHQQTAADGGFELHGLRTVPHRLAVHVPGYVAFDGWVKPGGKPLEVGLLRASTLVGSVVDEDGQPVAQAELEVRGQSEVGLEVRIGASFAAPLMAAAVPGARGASATASGSSTPELPGGGDNLGVVQGRVPAIPLSGPLPGAAAFGGDAASLALAFRSDEHGAFRLEGLPPGAMRVVARKLGYATGASEPLSLPAGAVKEGVRVVLSRGGVIVGRLVDTAGSPVEHVRVEARIEGDPEPRSALSDQDGSFRFEAMRGECSITAYPYGLPPVRAPALQIGAGDERTLALVIDAVTHTLEGRVLDSRQHPLENASVNLQALDTRSPFSITVLSGPDGRFEIPGLPAPPYRISADQAEYAPSRPLKVSRVDEPVIIVLGAGSDLRGVVVDASSNEPLAGAQVALVARSTKATLTMRSQADGSFEFLHVNDGNYSVFIDAEGMMPSTREVALAASESPGDAPHEETFVLTPAGSTSGDVVDRLGAPLWNAEVAAGKPAEWAHAARTDHAGHFVLEGLAPGDTYLSAREGSAGEVTFGASVRVYARQETPGVVLRLPGVAGPEPELDEPAPAKRKKRASDAR